MFGLRSGTPSPLEMLHAKAKMSSNTKPFKRGVGYCMNGDCPDMLKGTFLLNPDSKFLCPHCRYEGTMVLEYREFTRKHGLFRQVRVEYDYEPVSKVYKALAVVSDESLPPHLDVYTLYSPLIKTEKRALKVAESILANLLKEAGKGTSDEDLAQGSGMQAEMVLSLDTPREEFLEKLKLLNREWSLSSQAAERAISGLGKS